MIVSYVSGDLIKMLKSYSEKPNMPKIYSAHGCNCFNAMGSGYAPLLKKAFPAVGEVDTKYYNMFENDKDRLKNMLGTVFGTRIGDNLVIMNAYTQYHPGPDLRLDALGSAFSEMNYTIGMDSTERGKNKVRILYIPMIGAGIAGGDWKEISRVIDENTPNIYVVVYCLPGTYIPTVDKEEVKKFMNNFYPESLKIESSQLKEDEWLAKYDIEELEDVQ